MAQQKRSKKAPPPSRLAELRERFESGDLVAWGRGLVISGWLLLATALVLGLFMGVPAMRRAAAAAAPPTDVRVAFLAPPAWMVGDLALHLEELAAGEIIGNALDREDLLAARAALLESGWFTDILQVRRVSPELVEIDAQFVEPYAAVRDFDGDHLVDPSGRLLPHSTPVGQAPQFIAVEGAYYQRPEAIGMQWEGADITAALRLVQLVNGYEWHSQVAAIDVSNYMQTGQLAIITDRGSRLTWGSAPGDEPAHEASTEIKVEYLGYPFATYGHIDGGYDALDLTSSSGIYPR